MNFKKDLSAVAAEVAKIMEAELSKKQKEIAKLDHPKHKIDAGDLAKLRAGHKPVKEEAEQLDELKKTTLQSYVNKRNDQENSMKFTSAKKGVHIAKMKAVAGQKIQGPNGSTHYVGSPKVKVHATEEVEQITEDDLPITTKKSKTVTVKHETSGKEKVIVDTPNAREENKKLGYHPMKEETVQEGIEDKIEAARKKAKAAGKKVEEPKKPAAPAKRKVEGKAYGGSKQKEDMDESVLPFTAMLESYTEHGLKAFVKEQVEEEVELEEAKMNIPDSHVKAMKDAYGSGRVHASDGMIHHTGKGLYGKETNSHSYKDGKIGRHVATKTIEEEVDNDTFKDEVEDQKASMEGKKKQPKVSAPSTQGVKDMDEEVEQIDELKKDTLKSYVSKATDSSRTMPGYGTKTEKSKKTMRHTGISRAMEKLAKEEVEQIEEGQMNKMSLGQLMHKHAQVYSQAGSAKYGKRQHSAEKAIERHVKEYGSLIHKDMMDHSDYHQHFEDGNEKTELTRQQRNRYHHIRGKYKIGESVEQIEERTLSEPETEKKEKYVKSMKKNLKGFKERYGERAKSVMYATATKMAKKD